MSVNSDIRDSIKAIALDPDQVRTFSAEVVSVDVLARTCEVTSVSDPVETTYTDVGLMPCSADGLLYVPQVGSTVIVQTAPNMQPFILMWSDLDEIRLDVGGSSAQLTTSLIKFNKGELGGLINIEPLVSAINKLQSEINDLKSKFIAWSPALGDGGLALKTILTATPPIWTAPPIPLTTRADIEDTKITH